MWAMQDYAGAWSAERGRCHRFVYGTEDGHPEHCPRPPVSSGWRRDGTGRWFAVDACAEHSSLLLRLPERSAGPHRRPKTPLRA
jgi:hypothetical protein